MIYFVQSTASGLIKIGYARHVGVRLSNLQTGSPDPLKLLAAVDGGPEDEARLHGEFAAYRLRGEWFRPSDELTSAIAREAARAGADISEVRTTRSPVVMDEFTAEAAGWAKYLEDRLAERRRLPVSVIRSELAEILSVSVGLLHNLRRSRIEHITAADREAILQATLAEKGIELSELRALRAELRFREEA